MCEVTGFVDVAVSLLLQLVDDLALLLGLLLVVLDLLLQVLLALLMELHKVQLLLCGPCCLQQVLQPGETETKKSVVDKYGDEGGIFQYMWLH